MGAVQRERERALWLHHAHCIQGLKQRLVQHALYLHIIAAAYELIASYALMHCVLSIPDPESIDMCIYAPFSSMDQHEEETTTTTTKKEKKRDRFAKM